MEHSTRVDLPAYVGDPYEVFINGVPQVAGRDFVVAGRSLYFERAIAREGKLGIIRWLSMLLGVAGTYRKHETIDVVFSFNGQRKVVSLAPAEPDVEASA